MNENRKRNLVAALFYSFRRPLSSDEREREEEENRISFHVLPRRKRRERMRED